MPVAPHAAVIPGKYYHYGQNPPFSNLSSPLNASTGYSATINLLDYSSVCLPVTRADKSIDKFDHEYNPLSDLDRENWQACT